MDNLKGIKKFKQGFNCAQSVVSHYSDRLNISENIAIKLTQGFGAGIARTGQICGALSGAVFVLNDIYGDGESNDPLVRDLLYKKIEFLLKSFEEECGTSNCKQLINGCNLLTEEGQKKFKEENLIENCFSYVEKVINIMDGIISESKEP